MPIIKKLIPAGKTSKAVILPKGWLEYFEQKAGQPITVVALEVDDFLKIWPLVPKDGKNQVNSNQRKED